MKKFVLLLALIIVLPVAWFYIVGSGWLGSGWSSPPVTAGPRPVATPATGTREPQVLFGDLHTHTSYSLDAYLFSMRLVKGTGITTPADACDFARYCSGLDFWSINDHAEGLTPRVWADTLQVIRECNANAGDPAHPDMVSFVGWEWSNSERDDVPSHYGHKDGVVRTWEEGMAPVRPIAWKPQYPLAKAPAALLGLISLVDDVRATADLGWYTRESNSVRTCPDDVSARDLPLDCREVALTPLALYRKLDEWGFDSMVIPHGLAWGTTNPLTADFRTQLAQYEQRYQNLLEVYSGHGNSELFEDFQRIGFGADGEPFCPPATDNFTPCCQQAAVIARERCADPASNACDAEVETMVGRFLAEGPRAGRKVLDDTVPSDWQGCGQLRNTFQPASAYVPRMSAQYVLALGFDDRGREKRARFGLIGSSDIHQARPGPSYKESNRVLYTDHKGVGKGGVSPDVYRADKESGAFYYTGGLVAVHATGRDRDAIWGALSRRNVYATSGDRTLVWFDLLNGPRGEAPMGSQVAMAQAPVFRVRALGAFEQVPGCPDYTLAALGEARARSLCGGECFRPGDRRRAIDRVEIVRIRPQVSPDERIAPLIDDPWRTFDCSGSDAGFGCAVEFRDDEFAATKRPALYYARVIQEAQLLIQGDPFGCEYDEQGNCLARNYCIGDRASVDNDCLAEAQPRAWTSPIFVEYRN